MDELSVKQKEVFDYIKQEVREKGYPPSVREICDAVSLKSTSTVHGHLERLEKKGYIRRDPAKPRTIEITEKTVAYERNRELVNVPIIGTVTAGVPILAVENIEDTFPIPVEYVGNHETFMLRVKGDSMIDAGIFDKDLIWIRSQITAKNGDMVVALIEDYATVKTFYRENGHIRLQPENSTMSPIIVEKCSILGKVIGLFRHFNFN